jgi:orotidine-5'-phosphate decarboxylase
MSSRIILPLDNVPWDDARRIMQRTQGLVWGYKLRRSILEHGLGVVEQVKAFGKVMLDFKLYDIPSAMTESLAMHLQAGADITTVHCTADYDPIVAGMSAEHLAGVTILTSTAEEDCRRYYRGQTISEMVVQMARRAEGRYEYLVCSPKELQQIASLQIKKICPGVRPLWYAAGDDQARTATPADAIRDGADLLVIGRPILKAADMVAALEQSNAEIEAAL